MWKRIKSFLFPELEELKEQADALEDCISDINELRLILENVSVHLGRTDAEVKLLVATPALITNLQERVSGLEEKYQNHREFKPMPNSHGTFRSLRQSLERGAYAKSRNFA